DAAWLRRRRAGPAGRGDHPTARDEIGDARSRGEWRVSVTFYVYLWARPGMEQDLVAYEDTVLALVDEHGGRLVHRSRTDGRDGRPFEIQLFEWPSQAALDGYMAD